MPAALTDSWSNIRLTNLLVTYQLRNCFVCKAFNHEGHEGGTKGNMPLRPAQSSIPAIVAILAILSSLFLCVHLCSSVAIFLCSFVSFVVCSCFSVRPPPSAVTPNHQSRRFWQSWQFPSGFICARLWLISSCSFVSFVVNSCAYSAVNRPRIYNFAFV